MATITFKAKERIIRYTDDKLHLRYIPVPTITRAHCDMSAFRQHPQLGSYANSDLFLGMVRRKLIGMGVAARVVLENEEGKVAIPECVTVEPGFLATVTITL